MDEFVQKVVDSLTAKGKRLSIVRNPDGFLLRPDTQQNVLDKSGLLLLPVSSSIELRVRYELSDKNSNNKVCYIMNTPHELLPDLKFIFHIAPPFSVSSLLPACNETELLRAGLTFGMATYIYNKKYVHNLFPAETRELIKEAANLYGEDIHELSAHLKDIPLKWDQAETMDTICSLLIKAIRQDAYAEIEPVINELNEDFQQYINDRYFTLPSSSHIKKPKMVNQVLPYLMYKHQHTDKIALIVIDGMSYWQYLVLDKALNDKGMQTHKDITFAWLPSITKLSRQAIFRGNTPQNSYHQTPTAEKNLWTDFWTSSKRPSAKYMKTFEIGYTHNSLLTDNKNLYRQAFVDIELDGKMHSSSDNKDLYDLTHNWAKDAAEKIKHIQEQEYQIYITADHGNIYSHAWRTLKSQEKTYLFQNGSRGSRHLSYEDVNYLKNFLQSNKEIEKELLVRDNWAVWRNAKCFKGQDEITHGGSHFLEVIIPFVTIEKK
ncbi:PglZ domain-containing protein [Parabacteroides pacaensis]|uniref:PglZ domain-containing protein n=1 Tax=Parabacteroides pacaensis TaxID=2086575 RepID=UPI000D10F3D5|nr:PglZ domain-containing protein [Parabacteroides pacaensis]